MAHIIPQIIIEIKLPYKKINRLYNQQDSNVVGIVISVRINVFLIIGGDMCRDFLMHIIFKINVVVIPSPRAKNNECIPSIGVVANIIDIVTTLLIKK